MCVCVSLLEKGVWVGSRALCVFLSGLFAVLCEPQKCSEAFFIGVTVLQRLDGIRLLSCVGPFFSRRFFLKKWSF